MTDPNHSPVSLPPRSLDYDALKSGLQDAAHGAQGKYDGNVASAIERSATGPAPAVENVEPGYKLVDVRHRELPITERLEVFDAKHAPADPDQPTRAPARKRSRAKRPAAKSAAKPVTAKKQTAGAPSAADAAVPAPTPAPAPAAGLATE